MASMAALAEYWKHRLVSTSRLRYEGQLTMIFRIVQMTMVYYCRGTCVYAFQTSSELAPEDLVRAEI